MTDGSPRPDEEPAPPTSTAWDADAETGDDELAPPFVPGAATPAEAGETSEEPFPFEDPDAGGDATDRDAGPAGSDDEFPFEAFDIEGAESEPDPETPSGPAPSDVEADRVTPASTPPSAAAEAAPPGGHAEPARPEAKKRSTAAHELADRLEAMAARLRERGAEAAEAEMSAPDRFTALLAGLLAGYLAGRE